jgi:hypothetical protein
MFGSAVLDRVIGGSPCVGVQLPEVEKADLLVPTVEQVAAAGRRAAEAVRCAAAHSRRDRAAIFHGFMKLTSRRATRPPRPGPRRAWRRSAHANLSAASTSTHSG